MNAERKVFLSASQTVVPVLQGYYFTGDGCKRDKDGYFWITGKKLMHSYQGGAESSLNGMPASHCVQTRL